MKFLNFCCYMILNEINFTFISIFYERLARTVKSTLRKILGKLKLDFEELYTILTQVECVLNWPPLPNVYTEENCKTIPPSHLFRTKFTRTFIWYSNRRWKYWINCNNMYKHCNHLLKLINDLLKRSKREYLCELWQQQMYNCRKYSDAEKLVLNDMVFIKDNDVTHHWIKWKKVVIDELIKGSDGKVRGATLRVCT